MKKKLLLLFFCCFNLITIAQTKFEPSYFINNAGEKINCLIKNLDWRKNPANFDYKLTDSSIIETIDIQEVKEFEILNISKYIRFTVEIDQSSNNIINLSKNEAPDFQKETLFLKCIIEGNANLYKYMNENVIRFFYSKNNQNPIQLISKEYTNKYNEIQKNNTFKSQIYNNLESNKISKSRVRKLSYKESELKNIFIDFNQNGYKEYNKISKQEKNKINIKVIAGIDYSSLSLKSNYITARDVDFGGETNYRIGIESEFILPFNNNKWSVFIAPTFHSFSKTTETSIQTIKIEYKAIEIPIGLRHYLFLEKNSKIFINAAVVLDKNFNSSLESSLSSTINPDPSINLACGVGYGYKNFVSLEFRYNTERDIIGSLNYSNSGFQSSSILLSFTIF